MTAIHRAATRFCFERVKLFLERSADINTKDDSGKYVIDFLYESLKDRSLFHPKEYKSIVKVTEFLVNEGINLDGIEISKAELIEMLNNSKHPQYI
jgi:hypothetical protein